MSTSLASFSMVGYPWAVLVTLLQIILMLFGYKNWSKIESPFILCTLKYLHLRVCEHDFQQRFLPGTLAISHSVPVDFFPALKRRDHR